MLLKMSFFLPGSEHTMKVRTPVVIASLMLLLLAGCKDKGPDLSDIPTPQPPPGPNPVAAPGAHGPGPKTPAPPAANK